MITLYERKTRYANDYYEFVADTLRMESMKKFIEICDSLLGAGVFDSKLYAQAVQNYVEKGAIDLGLTEDIVSKLDENMANEIENINIDEV